MRWPKNACRGPTPRISPTAWPAGTGWPERAGNPGTFWSWPTVPDAGSPPDISEKRYNRLALKKRLLNDIWKETTPEMDCGFAISYLPEAKAAMDERMILESDVTSVLQYVRETGEAIQDCGTGLIIARRRLGNVTFWVKYEERDGGYLVHSAYSHRMNVQTR
jgi:hypothetical protein